MHKQQDAWPMSNKNRILEITRYPSGLKAQTNCFPFCPNSSLIHSPSLKIPGVRNEPSRGALGESSGPQDPHAAIQFCSLCDSEVTSPRLAGGTGQGWAPLPAAFLGLSGSHRAAAKQHSTFPWDLAPGPPPLPAAAQFGDTFPYFRAVPA